MAIDSTAGRRRPSPATWNVNSGFWATRPSNRSMPFSGSSLPTYPTVLGCLRPACLRPGSGRAGRASAFATVVDRERCQSAPNRSATVTTCVDPPSARCLSVGRIDAAPHAGRRMAVDRGDDRYRRTGQRGDEGRLRKRCYQCVRSGRGQPRSKPRDLSAIGASCHGEAGSIERWIVQVDRRLTPDEQLGADVGLGQKLRGFRDPSGDAAVRSDRSGEDTDTQWASGHELPARSDDGVDPGGDRTIECFHREPLGLLPAGGGIGSVGEKPKGCLTEGCDGSGSPPAHLSTPTRCRGRRRGTGRRPVFRTPSTRPARCRSPRTGGTPWPALLGTGHGWPGDLRSERTRPGWSFERQELPVDRPQAHCRRPQRAARAPGRVR